LLKILPYINEYVTTIYGILMEVLIKTLMGCNQRQLIKFI